MGLASLTPFDFIILICATWRLANMLSREHGPFRVFSKMRERFPLGGLTACVYCMSIWCALPLLLIYAWAPVLNILIWVLAISGGALLLRSFTGAGHDA
jgi:O-antigen/teichoic acid export membrane protein